jgi:hypothetical protein
MSRRGNQRKRERHQQRHEQRKLEAQTNPPVIGKPPRLGITAEIIEDLERRSLANIIAELESKQ